MASKEDGEAILACLAAAFDAYRKEYTPGAFRDTVLDSQTIHDRLRDMAVLVAISEATIVGTIGCQANGEEGHLRGMAVLPRWQGSGVATALLQAAENELRSRGCQYATLDTTEPLQRAIRFYERHGFSASGKISEFFGMRLHEYSKPLLGTPATVTE